MAIEEHKLQEAPPSDLETEPLTWDMNDLLVGKWYRSSCTTSQIPCTSNEDCTINCLEGSQATCKGSVCYSPPENIMGEGKVCGEGCTALLFGNTQSNTVLTQCIPTKVHLNYDCSKVVNKFICPQGTLMKDGRCAPKFNYDVVHYTNAAGAVFPLTVHKDLKSKILQLNPNMY